MSQKRILVTVGATSRDLKGLHYALALAERMDAQVYVLQQTRLPGIDPQQAGWMEEAMLKVINMARQAGVAVSHHVADGEFNAEVISLVKTEAIDLLVFDEADESSRRLLLQIKPLVASRIIQVSEKESAWLPNYGRR